MKNISQSIYQNRTEFFSHMTARPLDPRAGARPVSAAVALVLLLAMVMAAGCMGRDYVPEQ